MLVCSDAWGSTGLPVTVATSQPPAYHQCYRIVHARAIHVQVSPVGDDGVGLLGRLRWRSAAAWTVPLT